MCQTIPRELLPKSMYCILRKSVDLRTRNNRILHNRMRLLASKLLSGVEKRWVLHFGNFLNPFLLSPPPHPTLPRSPPPTPFTSPKPAFSAIQQLLTFTSLVIVIVTVLNARKWHEHWQIDAERKPPPGGQDPGWRHPLPITLQKKSTPPRTPRDGTKRPIQQPLWSRRRKMQSSTSGILPSSLPPLRLSMFKPHTLHHLRPSSRLLLPIPSHQHAFPR